MKNYKIALLILFFMGIVGILNAQTKAKSQTPTPTSIQPASGIFTHYSQKEIIVGFKPQYIDPKISNYLGQTYDPKISKLIQLLNNLGYFPSIIKYELNNQS